MAWHEVIPELQTEIVGRLNSADYFSDLVILEQRKGIIESDVETALGIFNEETGKKIGAVVICIMPEITAHDSDAPSPDLTVKFSFQVLTLRIINDDTDNNGSGKLAESIAANVLMLLHHYHSGHIGVTLGATRNPIVPLANREDGTVSYLVQIEGVFNFARANKVATPQVSFSGAVMTITCATGYGETIYYTIDGSYPGPANAAALIYTAPVTLESGARVVAGAVLDQWQPSNTTPLYVVSMSVVSIGDDTMAGVGGGTVLGTGDLGSESNPFEL